MSRIFVSGSNLQWLDTVGLATRSVCGAIPNPIPSGFSGQAVGRVWVAQEALDNGLYYSDAAGQTRFLSGIYRGELFNSPAGRVFTMKNDCTPIADLWWTTPSASSVLAWSVRSEAYAEPVRIDLNWQYREDIDVVSMSAFLRIPTFTEVSNIKLIGYNSDDGGTSTCTGPSSTLFTFPTLSLGGQPEGGPRVLGTGSLVSALGPTVVGYKLDTSSMSINGIQTTGGNLDPVCVGTNLTYIFPTPVGCIATATAVYRCGTVCDENADCAAATDGCTKCSTNQPGIQVGICETENAGTPPGGGGTTKGCGAACDPENSSECNLTCTLCTANQNGPGYVCSAIAEE